MVDRVVKITPPVFTRQVHAHSVPDDDLNNDISLEDIWRAFLSLKLGNANGADNIAMNFEEQ